MARTKMTANTPFGERCRNPERWEKEWEQEYARYFNVLRGIDTEWRRNPPRRDIDQREFKAYVFCNYKSYQYYMQVS